MNNPRRKALSDIQSALEELKETLEELREEEEEYRNNIPENLWMSKRYKKSEEASSNLDSAYDSLEEVITYLESAIVI